MHFRLLLPLLALGVLTSGCFERLCGPNQHLSKKVCVCDEGTTQNADLECVPNKPVDAGPPEPASDAAVGSGGPTCSPEFPDGVGCKCTSDSDCAKYKADYCVIPDPSDAEMKRACLLQGCDKPGEECPAKQQCCKFTGFAPEGSVCLPETVDCPFGLAE